MKLLSKTRLLRAAATAAAVALVGIPAVTPAQASGIRVVTSSLKDVQGTRITATNHLVKRYTRAAVRANKLSNPSKLTATATAVGGPGEYLLVWAGDWNAGDNSAKTIEDRVTRLAVDPVRETNIELPDEQPGLDFLAVIDADPKSASYGKVVNTVTVAPIVENEPHHMQYIWHKGHRIFAGGLFGDTTYAFDVTQLPVVRLAGTNLPTDTPCGSVPDAYWTLKDGTAYGTYMGGPDVPGPCVYTDGSVRIGNGFAGTPGEIVHLDKNARTLSETAAALPTAEDATRCPGVPNLPVPSCANPHGIQVREDLNRLVASDYAEPKNVPIDPVRPIDAHLFRDTVRIFDISNRDRPKLLNIGVMPDGPRVERNPGHEEPRGIMETTVTNLPDHKGAFASSMCGGVIYYTPDITAAQPVWREVFDDTAASKKLAPEITEGAGCDGGGWVQTSLDDKYLYHAVIGRNPGSLGTDDPGVPKMVYTLDIEKLLAAGTTTQCAINDLTEVFDGGREADCPTVVDVLGLPDGTSGGPHWGTLDNFARQSDGTYKETSDVRRIAVSNYFVARSNVDGNHKVCMIDVKAGKMTIDTHFRDEGHGTPCVDFNRTVWPHGKTGKAKPHSELFVVPDTRLR